MSIDNWLVENKEELEKALELAKKLEAQRSPKSQIMDEGKSNKRLIDLSKSKHPLKDVKKWAKNMGGFDILGIDFFPDIIPTKKPKKEKKKKK